MSRLDTAAEQIEAALQAPADERAYHVRQACQVLPEEHPSRPSLEAALDADHAADVDGLLRAAYGALPPGRDRDDGSRADGGQATRRDVLASAAGVGAVGVASTGLNQHPGADDGSVLVKDDGDAIPAPFDAIPTLEDPPAKLRSFARNSLPPRAVPDGGPIPDPRHERIVEQPITVPEWGMEAVRWRLSHADPDDVDRAKVEGLLMEYAAVREQFQTPDGRDAADVLLAEVREGVRG